MGRQSKEGMRADMDQVEQDLIAWCRSKRTPVAAADLHPEPGNGRRLVAKHLAALAEEGRLETHRGLYWPPGCFKRPPMEEAGDA